MRVIILSFVSFILSGVFLLPNLGKQLTLPENYYFYAPLALMVLAILSQIDGVFSLRKVLKARQISDENDALSVELKDATEKLHNEKKSVTDYKSKFAGAEKDLRKSQEACAALEEKMTLVKEGFEKALAEEQRKLENLSKELRIKESQESSDVDVNLLQFLTLLQEKGRFLDFAMDDISRFPDQQVGAAARVVHSGCQKVISEYLDINPVRGEQEGSPIELGDAYDSYRYRLLGNVGEPPYKGTILHRGWKADAIKLPELVAQAESSLEHLKVLAPAEVELS